MQIREIKIDGFGIFNDKRLVDFRPGINVVYGPNEIGKTSLLEFIRRTLFGFPKRNEKKINFYQPRNGGLCGGSLSCQLKDGSSIEIKRVQQGTQVGDVIVETPTQSLSGQDSLNKLLNLSGKEIYQNIYAFTLDELQSVNSLHGDEIKNRIYGAGLGLGSVSLGDVEKWINDQSLSLFRPRGSTQALNALHNEIKECEREIRAIQQGVEKFDQLKETIRDLESQRESIGKNIEQLERSARHLEMRRDLYPAIAAMLAAENELKETPQYPFFPENGLQTLSQLQRERDAIQKRLQEERAVLASIQRDLEAVRYQPELLECESDIHYLQQSTEKVRSALQDLPVVENDRDNLHEKIQFKISKIDPSWNEERIASFEISEAEISQAHEFYQDLDTLRQAVNQSKGKLELHKERKASELSQGNEIPIWLSYFSKGLGGIGLICALLGAWLLNYLLIAFSLVMLAMGVILHIKTRNQHGDFQKEDLLEKNLQNQLQSDQQLLDEKRDAWAKWLTDKGLDPRLPPLNTEKIGENVDEIRRMIADRTRHDQRIQSMKATLDEARQLSQRIAQIAPNLSSNSDVSATIELISALFEDTKKTHAKKTLLETRAFDQEKRIEGLTLKADEVNQKMTQFIANTGAGNEEDFQLRQEAVNHGLELKQTIEQNKRLIEAQAGLGKSFDAFIASAMSSTPADTESEKQNVDERLRELQGRKDQIMEMIGENKKESDQIASNDDLAEAQNLCEQKKQQLNEASRRWATLTLSRHILQKAKRTYEETRQPGVIKSSANLFSKITQGRYSHIIKPIDEDDLLIEDPDGRRKRFMEMSRGTREQLYLSMRLGLIEEYESRSEPLPVIMDDVFVNFDDDRAQQVIQEFKRFAETRQVIIMTCHRWSLEAFKQVDAHFISLQPEAE
ncbi:MAG: AAA family ATPase [Candidatus Nitrohelix vancouverensis]|uniref:AAA family ATPase n=1 Tax=Candidatus Nitrohelix vancouverensis TaxID=2705534 RepID=A0A7T0C239_9BACT|nr:MAG: AAA family ATPase [Candidatus Nitrohelix vancouverensis]